MDRALWRSARSKVAESTGSNTIPFSETRNYVQRIIENLQVYRAGLAAVRGCRSKPICTAAPAPNRRSPPALSRNLTGRFSDPKLARRRPGAMRNGSLGRFEGNFDRPRCPVFGIAGMPAQYRDRSARERYPLPQRHRFPPGTNSAEAGSRPNRKLSPRLPFDEDFDGIPPWDRRLDGPLTFVWARAR